MKTKHILISIALPTLFVACADNDLVSGPSTDAENGNLVKLEKGFAVAITSEDNAATRAAWQLEGWGKALYPSWIPDTIQPSTGTYAIKPEYIGFAWRGESPDAKVRTNYKFELSGYLKNGQSAPKFKNCNDELLITNGYKFGTVTNGEIALDKYDDATHAMTPSDYKLKLNATGDWELQNNSTKVNDMYDASKLGENDPNVQTGIFTTTNSTVFKGDYIVYFPYNEKFAEIDYLPATSPDEFTMDTRRTKNLTAHLTGKTFAYGTATIQNGGSMAEGFVTKHLSTIIALNLVNKTGNLTAQKVSKVILHDEGNEQGFYTSVGLDADKISKEGSETTGESLYVVDENTTYSPTLKLNFVSAAGSYASLANNAKQVAVMAALPIDLVKPVVYVVFDGGMSVKKELEPKPLKGGKVAAWDVELTADDIKAENQVRLVVDNLSLLKAFANIAQTTTSADNATIETLGNITLNGKDDVTYSSNHFSFDLTKATQGIKFDRNITIKGTGTITVPAGVTCWLKGLGTSKDNKPTITIENPIVIESAGCCGSKPGTLVLGLGTDKYGNYDLKSVVTNYGRLMAGVNNGEGTFTFGNGILNKYDKENDYAGEVYFTGGNDNVIVVNGKIDNEGIVCLKDSVFDVPTDKWTKFNAGRGRGLVVNAKGGIDNAKDSKLEVRGDTRLNLGGSSVNNGEIEIVTKGQATNDLKDGTLMMEQGSTLNNNGTIHNRGVFTNDRGTLNLNEGSEFVDFVGSQYGGVPAAALGGGYVCEVDDANTVHGDRLAAALGSSMSTTVVRFVEGPQGASYTYDLKAYKDYAKLATVKYEFTANKVFEIKNTDADKNGYIMHTFGSGVTVNGADSVKFSTGIIEIGEDGLTAKTGVTVVGSSPTSTATLTVNGDVNMEAGSDSLTVCAKSDKAANETTTKDLTVTGNVNLKGNVVMELVANGAMAVGGSLTIDGNAEAVFQYSSYTDVANAIGINGTFTRVLSSGVDNANPAKVWCESYTTGSGATFTNGYPEVRPNRQ